MAEPELRQFTRAEVAENHCAKLEWDAEAQIYRKPQGSRPYIILSNKVYDISDWLEDHPGGEVILMDKAGKDATRDFEDLQHSDLAREKRNEFLVGEIVEAEREVYTSKTNESEGSSSSGSPMLLRLGGAALLALYVRQTLNSRPIPGHLTYSGPLRHLHLAMAAGLFGGVGFVQAALRTEDMAARKAYMSLHKSCGLLMLGAIVVRAWLRFKSAIPPRFPGSPALQLAETASHRAIYAILLAMPLTGLAYDRLSGSGIELFGSTLAEPGKDEAPSSAELRSAKKYIDWHRTLGQAVEYLWIPFHLGVTALHFSNGRDVVRRISPFI